MKLLGQGGFGVVYSAKDLKTDGLVAVKFFVKGKMGDEDSVYELLNLFALDKICKEFICVLDAGRWNKNPFLVLTHLNGKNLENIQKNDPSYFYTNAVALYKNIRQQLKKLHSVGLAHQDIKLNNIMLVKGVPVVIDFGLICNKPKCPIDGCTYYFSPVKMAALRKNTTITLKQAQDADFYALAKSFMEAYQGRMAPPELMKMVKADGFTSVFQQQSSWN
jgi:serine/threonine protein kinase